MHTLFSATKDQVCASIADGRWVRERNKGKRMEERRSCGKNARDSRFEKVPPVEAVEDADAAEEAYSNVLYGEKLCRWSILVRW